MGVFFFYFILAQWYRFPSYITAHSFMHVANWLSLSDILISFIQFK